MCTYRHLSKKEKKSASYNFYLWILVLWSASDKPNPYSLPSNIHWNNWIFPVVEYTTELVEVHNANRKENLSPVMILQCVEALGTCTPSHGFELCGQIQSWQISQGFVKSINYKLWNLGQWKFIIVYLVNVIKVFSVLIWWCLTTVCKEWRFSLENTDVIEQVLREDGLLDY